MSWRYREWPVLPAMLMLALLAGCGATPAAPSTTVPTLPPSSTVLAPTVPATATVRATFVRPSATPRVPPIAPTAAAAIAPADAPAGSRGATVPWIEYEAEDGVTNGVVLDASRTFGDIAAESSGRRSVRLDATGQYLRFTAVEAANSIVLRYVIPDAPEGGGINATLSLYVDNTFRQKLTLTSTYAWSYGGESETSNNPADGGAHHFFDEARALLEPIPVGATVMLRKDTDDLAAYYVVDLIDLEQVAPAAEMPASFLPITDCGALPDDNTDDGQAIQTCISRAQIEGRGVWIPPGTFAISTPIPNDKGIDVADVTIQGAGMWHATLKGPYARFYCTGNNCRFADFAILGEATTRDDKLPENGFNGAAGVGSRVDRVWVEHTKVGWWVGASGSRITNGLVISGSRFRNLFADGVNFCNGTSHSVVEQSHFRNTGDDALASWAPSNDGGVNTGNVFRFNTVQLPWRASCFAIYGGKDTRVEDNLCADVVTYPGILIAQQFDAWPFAGTTVVQRTSLIRAGGRMWGQEHGALKIDANQDAIGGIVVTDLLIDSPTYAGIQIAGAFAVTDLSFTNMTIARAGTYGILVDPATAGGATLDAVVVTDPVEGGLSNPPGDGFEFTLLRGVENSGW